ncbi:MAG: hypothetical protein R2991_11065 [Thermoanaerobaculia bacterium]
MDQRYDELLRQRAGELARDAAQQVDGAFGELGGRASPRPRGQGDIRVHEEQDVAARAALPS